MRRLLLIPRLTVLGAALLFSMGAFLLVENPMARQDATGQRMTLPATTGETTPGFNPIGGATSFLRPTTWYQAMEPTKRAGFAQWDRQIRADATAAALTPGAGYQWPPIPLPPATPWSPIPHQTLGAGALVEGKQSPFSSADFTGRNHWFEVLVDRSLSVYAGGEGYMGDSSRGVLKVLVSSVDGLTPLAPGERYDTPLLKGPIRIIDAVGERLTLEAPDGTRFTFDVAARQWIDP